MARWLPVVAAQVPARDPATALDELEAEVHELMADFPRTRLIVYPEYHTCRVLGAPEVRRERYAALAEPLDSPRSERLAAIAHRAGVWLVPGTIIEAGPAGEVFNTAVAYSPRGERMAAYRKIFPWRPFEPFDAGSRFVTFTIPDLGTVGLCTCYDIWFPEVARQLTWMGADLIVCPAQTSTIDRAQELVLARATAIQNQVFVLSVNAAAPDGTGRTIVVDPEGLVRAQAPSESPTYLTDVLDLDAVAKVRELGTCGLNRIWHQVRPDDVEVPLPLYGGSITAARWAVRRK
jgi:predicted amidohydrolase